MATCQSLGNGFQDCTNEGHLTLQKGVNQERIKTRSCVFIVFFFGNTEPISTKVDTDHTLMGGGGVKFVEKEWTYSGVVEKSSSHEPNC